MYGNPDVCAHTNSQILEAANQGRHGHQNVDATYPADNPRTFARGGHGLFSTAPDYLRFAQMLLQRGELDGARILGPKIADLMHMNHIPSAQLPIGIGYEGYGFGLGSRVLLNVAESGMPGSVGEFGWGGAAKTYYWVDPVEELVGIVMAQFMIGFDTLEKDFQTLAYQAMIG
jgi:CubicO group peptidase (beta-lactamase class C family)